MKIYRSYSSDETKKFGAKLARQVLGGRLNTVGGDKKAFILRRAPAFAEAMAGRRDKRALIFALRGDLGSGKTTFTQGFLRGLGIKERVNSPTFVLMKRFKLRNKKFKSVYHLDCYRIKKSQELLDLGMKEIFDDPENIVFIEWPELIKEILPKNAKKIVFKYGTKENERKLYL